MLGKCLAQNTKKSCENLQSVDNIECIKQFITLDQSVPFRKKRLKRLFPTSERKTLHHLKARIKLSK